MSEYAAMETDTVVEEATPIYAGWKDQFDIGTIEFHEEPVSTDADQYALGPEILHCIIPINYPMSPQQRVLIPHLVPLANIAFTFDNRWVHKFREDRPPSMDPRCRPPIVQPQHLYQRCVQLASQDTELGGMLRMIEDLAADETKKGTVWLVDHGVRPSTDFDWSVIQHQRRRMFRTADKIYVEVNLADKDDSGQRIWDPLMFHHGAYSAKFFSHSCVRDFVRAAKFRYDDNACSYCRRAILCGQCRERRGIKLKVLTSLPAPDRSTDV